MCNQENLRTAALFYARKGLPVLPVYEMSGKDCACGCGDCSSPAKHPRVKQGFKDATTRATTINSWWDKWSDASIGVATGNGYVVIDIDSYHSGDDGLAELCAGNDLPDTWETLTGGGGRHLWFLIPEDVSVASKVGIATGVDVRGDGGYVIMPPSVHQSGRGYEWEVSARIDEIDIAPMPDWLERLLVGDKNPENVDPPKVIPKGQRRYHHLQLAGLMRHYGCDAHEMRAAMYSLNKRCDPATPESEIDDIAVDVERRYKPGGVPLQILQNHDTPAPVRPVNVKPFPLDVLPYVLQTFVKEAAAAIRVPPDLVAVPMLSVLGAAIGTKRFIEPKKNWQEYPVIWTAVVARPGEGKSPAQKLVARPIYQLQTTMKAQYEEEMADYKQEVKAWKQEEATDNPEPTAPVLSRVAVSDATIEALGPILSQNPHGLLLIADELTGWVKSMDQYKSGKGADRQKWLSIWSVETVTKDRVNQAEPIIIDKPFVCVMGGMPPDVLGELVDSQGREDGFVHRILMAHPDEVDRGWSDAEVSDETMDKYCEIVNRLRSLPGEGAVYYTPKAKKILSGWVDAHHKELRDTPDELRGAYAKYEVYMVRFSLIMHIVRSVCGEAIGDRVDEKSVSAAAAIIEYFKSHAQRVYGALYATKEDRQVTGVLEWMRRRKLIRVTVRELTTNYRGNGCKRADEARATIVVLAKCGHGRVEEEANPNGTTSTTFILEKDSAVSTAI